MRGKALAQYLGVLLLMNVGALLFGITVRFTSNTVTMDTNSSPTESQTLGRTFDQDHILPQVPTENTTSDGFKVPNIVHYIWYNEKTVPLQFHHMLSMLSAHKVLKPDKIYFHTDREPNGPYWEMARRIPSVEIVYREPPTVLFGEKVKPPLFYTSHSNVDRVKILMEYGGIYLDFDVLVTRSFNDLRRRSCVIGQEQQTKACGSVIVCEKSSFFLVLWINTYLDDYRIDEWAYNTGQVPFNLATRYPHLAYIEPTKLNHPNFKELDILWGPNTFNWRDNYAVHLWYRLWKDRSPYYHGIEPNPETIKTMNNTFGEIARSIYYGRPDVVQ